MYKKGKEAWHGMRIYLYGRKNKKEAFKSLTSFSVASKELLNLFLKKALQNFPDYSEYTLRIVFNRLEVEELVPEEEKGKSKGR